MGNDQGWYIVLARALRRITYANLQFVGAPPHTKFPPAFPALLSLFGVTSYDHFDRGIALNAGLSALALAFTYLTLRRTSRLTALLATTIAAINPTIVGTAGTLLAEPLFMALTAIALFALSCRKGWQWTATGMGALVVAGLTRPIGVTVISGVVAWWCFHRRWREAFVLAALTGVTVGGWFAWSATTERTLIAGQSYFADVIYAPPQNPGAGVGDESSARALPVPEPVPGVGSEQVTQTGERREPMMLPRILLRRALLNGRDMLVRQLPSALVVPAIAGTRAETLVWLAVATLLIVASGVVTVRRLQLLLVCLAAYLALLLIWPFVLPRYYGPVLPWVFALLLNGAQRIGERIAAWRPAFVRAPVLIAGTTLLVLAGREDWTRWRAIARCERAHATESPVCFADDPREFFAAARLATRISKEGAIFLVSKEAIFYNMTGRRTVWEAELAQARDPREFEAYLDRTRVEYVLLSRTSLNQWSMAKPLLSLCHRMRVIQEVGAHTWILAVAQGGAPGRDACPAVARWAELPWPDSETLLGW